MSSPNERPAKRDDDQRGPSDRAALPPLGCNWCGHPVDGGQACKPEPCECEDCCDDGGQQFTGHWNGREGTVLPLYAPARSKWAGKHQEAGR